MDILCSESLTRDPTKAYWTQYVLARIFWVKTLVSDDIELPHSLVAQYLSTECYAESWQRPRLGIEGCPLDSSRILILCHCGTPIYWDKELISAEQACPTYCPIEFVFWHWTHRRPLLLTLSFHRKGWSEVYLAFYSCRLVRTKAHKIEVAFLNRITWVRCLHFMPLWCPTHWELPFLCSHVLASWRCCLAITVQLGLCLLSPMSKHPSLSMHDEALVFSPGR